MLNFTFATAKEVRGELAARLKAHRIRLDVSQPELAQRAGVALGTVSSFEREGNATFDTVIKIIMALGLTNELHTLFAQLPTSIKEMEAAQQPLRKRVARKRKPV